MKKNKGITLIALVITIIVLLILAGVSIALLTGENGLIAKAIAARDKIEEAKLDEENKLAKTNEIMDQYVTNRDGSITIDSNTLNQMIETKIREQNTYSTEEKIVGEWIDGKTLYKKTFVYNTATSGNAEIVVGTINDMQTGFIDSSASYYINANSKFGYVGETMSINSSGRNSATSTYTTYSSVMPAGGVICRFGSTTASSQTVITVKYTKTTD